MRSKKFKDANALIYSQLQQQFDQWRANKPKNAHVPHALRQGVVNAIAQGMPTSKLEPLRLSHAQLKRWREQIPMLTQATPDFVTVEPVDENASTMIETQPRTCELNIHYPQGLRVDIRACDITLATQLLQILQQG